MVRAVKLPVTPAEHANDDPTLFRRQDHSTAEPPVLNPVGDVPPAHDSGGLARARQVDPNRDPVAVVIGAGRHDLAFPSGDGPGGEPPAFPEVAADVVRFELITVLGQDRPARL